MTIWQNQQRQIKAGISNSVKRVTCSNSASDLCRGDDVLLDNVVKAVQRILLPHKQLSLGQLVGMEPQLQKISASLGMDSKPLSSDVRMHGLHGFGGIGKTTLAEQFYEDAKQHFPSGRAVFLHVGQDAWLPAKQQELLQRINPSAATLSSDAALRTELRDSFRNGGPLLLVLDDLWSEEQLAALLACEAGGSLQCAAGELAPCSRILLTARDKAVFGPPEAAGLKLQEVEPLPLFAAQQLLCLRAFEQETPKAGFSEQQLAAAVSICGGLPLTLRLLGGALSGASTTIGWQVGVIRETA